ncbi:protein-L-isoaspartate(D-aspartate) O-methyltransferase [Sedimenticola selenatireducens]|uniref:Protein-L-isoaspartate O-methyltransferase n=1 Tax=Sedimenticola selenatireducens TaxID=191960 RepID=A0A557SFS2_9GAMM|nr:protein-L-isoaspartate(D-aspartate) O-methyltransferase [Sedimenticola selenatireducens]TVO76275.1 protein-L-isoaspartate(D-aspartate) O-methyltransferase [Sedimenticola selenatireducens]TVT61385.1 MAG: protein-L-isoaspartate(D-aspartate) O-methyltransferase [Sedimenticola selenatireducens]
MSSSVHRGIGMTSQRTRERLIQRLRDEGIQNQTVLEVVRNTPRHIFVDEALASRAYEDTALPIGQGQTISQPFIVARMTELLLEGGPLETVLEVGTGSGYQTAILSKLVKRVYSVERIKSLQLAARKRFQELHLRNIRLHHRDGGMGLPEYAPFDGILVTAAPEGIPRALVDQLKLGGRMILPIGSRSEQVLVRVTRTKNGYDKELLEQVVFVPLLGGTL